MNVGHSADRRRRLEAIAQGRLQWTEPAPAPRLPVLPMRFLLMQVVLLVLLAGHCLAQDAAEDVDFNREIRPILARHCFSCHGPDDEHREGGFRLDQRASAVGEADSGAPPVIPGDAANSELLKRIQSADADERMPPADLGKQLSPSEIDLLKRWIAAGAKYDQHWSFVPPSKIALPKPRGAQWATNPIDLFILSRMHKQQLEPSAKADRYELIRRLSFDLRGLPPSPTEIAHFVNDPRADAYPRLVERMLADPAYGEHLARMWLDIARYADSRGYGSDPLRMNMWRYRDWVIQALNQNMPFDQFTLEQLAGDLLPNPTLSQQMATAFHRNTMTNVEGGTDDEEFRVAAVRDRVDTTVQVWMGLTMGCAKCHSHKYDPISQREYYQVYDLFNQTADTDRADEFPTIPAPRPADQLALERYEQKLKLLQQQVKTAKSQIGADPQAAPIEARYVRVELPGKQRILSLAEIEVYAGGKNIAGEGNATQSSTAYEGSAARAIDGNTDGDYFRSNSVTHTATEDDPWWEVNLLRPHRLEKIQLWNRTGPQMPGRLNGAWLKALDEQRNVVWQQKIDKAPAKNAVYATRPLSKAERELQRLTRKLDQFKKQKPQLPTLPVMQELPAEKQRDTFVMIRGNFLSPGEPVEAGVPEGFHSWNEEWTLDRMGFARWILDERNPLTARVAVNRFWSQIFGVGLVETQEDFGTQGELPTHPELLDWLALEFQRLDWDIKDLLRLIVLSNTYQQTGRVTPDRWERDPRNRYLARGPRRRLSAESIRDQAMQLGGLLSSHMYGPSVYPYQPQGLWRAAFNGQRKWPISQGDDKYRRGVYTFLRRTVPYPSMAALDAPSREICTVRRIPTNTPLQVFVTLNDPVYVEAAQALARRLVREGGDTTEDRIRFGYLLCRGRPIGDRQRQALTQLFESERQHFESREEDAVKLATDPLGPLPAELQPAELAAWTVVANVLLNMDGLLNK